MNGLGGAVRNFIGVTILLFAFTPPAQAQTAQSSQSIVPVRDPQAIALLARSVAAMATAAGVQDTQATGTFSIAGDTSPFPIRLLSKGLRQARIETKSDDGTTELVLNQGTAVVTNPSGKSQHLNGINTAAHRVSHIPSLSVLASFTDNSTSVRYLGSDLVNGNPADILELCLAPSHPSTNSFLADASTSKLYIDQATATVSKIEFHRFAENSSHRQKIEVFFSDYQNDSGLLIPHTQRAFADGVFESELKLQSVQLNVGLPDTLFVLPEAQ
jgi:hypothetical protein